jgi:hypothetical protein
LPKSKFCVLIVVLLVYLIIFIMGWGENLVFGTCTLIAAPMITSCGARATEGFIPLIPEAGSRLEQLAKACPDLPSGNSKFEYVSPDGTRTEVEAQVGTFENEIGKNDVLSCATVSSEGTNRQILQTSLIYQMRAEAKGKENIPMLDLAGTNEINVNSIGEVIGTSNRADKAPLGFLVTNKKKGELRSVYAGVNGAETFTDNSNTLGVKLDGLNKNVTIFKLGGKLPEGSPEIGFWGENMKGPGATNIFSGLNGLKPVTTPK